MRSASGRPRRFGEAALWTPLRPKPVPAAASRVSRPGAARSVLLVHGHGRRRDALAAALRGDGHRVELSCDAVDALSRIAAGTDAPDAVVVQAERGCDDALRVCQVLRADGSEIVILVLSRTELADCAVPTLEAGADGYLISPFTPDEMLARLRALLRRRPIERKTKATTPRTAPSSGGTRSRGCGGCEAA
jgi:DNA-binding response OmpR family regulator